ncbi:hypothetical protein HDU80_006586, partial [Chytriomyces hyalinus]
MDESDSNSEYEEAAAALPQSAATATAEGAADAAAAKTKRKRRKRPKRKRKAAKTDADAAETEATEPVLVHADEPAVLEAADTHAATQVEAFDFEAFEQMVDMNEARLDWAADSVPKELQKYWRHRFSLFALFDQGIKLDY